MMRKWNKLSAVASLSVLSALPACSGSQGEKGKSPATVGGIALALDVSGLSVESVLLTVASEDTNPPVTRSRTLDVTDPSAAITATEQGLPAGDYGILLAASVVDDPSTERDESQVVCAGGVEGVEVVAGHTTNVEDLVLRCTEEGGDVAIAGGIRISASVGVETTGGCGSQVAELFVGAQQTSVGSEVRLGGAATTGGSLSWSATAGTVEDPTGVETRYVCPDVPGAYAVTLTAVGADGCEESIAVTVTCVGPDVPVCGNGVVEGDEACDDGNTETESCGYGAPDCEVCGASCVLAAATGAYCGDGVVNGPEACDGGDGCSSECTEQAVSLYQQCEACIADASQDAAYRSFNDLCNGDPLCVAVKQCLVEDTSGPGGRSCFVGRAPADCYCGVDSDLDACEADASFSPYGSCVDAIVAGTGDAARLDVLGRITSSSYATGQAYLIIDEATRVCSDACGFAAP